MSALRSATTALAGVAALLLVGSAAWAASLSVTSATLSTASLAHAAFHPTSVTIVRANGRTGTLNKGDQFQLAVSQQINATTVCPGASTTAATQTLAGVTATLLDGGTANDTLAVTAGPAGCPTPRFGVLDLGSPGYVSGASVNFTASDLTLTQGTASATLTLLLGTPSTNAYTTPGVATVIRYAPNGAIADTSGRLVRGTAASTSANHF